MDARVKKCHDCGIVVDAEDDNIDKCSAKRLYCEYCLALKNPQSKTERKIKKRYIQVTSITASILLILLIAINWEKNRNNNIFEYLALYGLGYFIVWFFASIFLMPVLMLMKKPYKEQIKQEKEKYIIDLSKKKELHHPLSEP